MGKIFHILLNICILIVYKLICSLKNMKSSDVRVLLKLTGHLLFTRCAYSPQTGVLVNLDSGTL